MRNWQRAERGDTSTPKERTSEDLFFCDFLFSFRPTLVKICPFPHSFGMWARFALRATHRQEREHTEPSGSINVSLLTFLCASSPFFFFFHFFFFFFSFCLVGVSTRSAKIKRGEREVEKDERESRGYSSECGALIHNLTKNKQTKRTFAFISTCFFFFFFSSFFPFFFFFSLE